MRPSERDLAMVFQNYALCPHMTVEKNLGYGLREDALSDSGEEEGGLLASEEDRTILVARVDSRTSARVGQTVRLAVDPSRVYFFSASTGESVLNAARAA